MVVLEPSTTGCQASASSRRHSAARKDEAGSFRAGLANAGALENLYRRRISPSASRGSMYPRATSPQRADDREGTF